MKISSLAIFRSTRNARSNNCRSNGTNRRILVLSTVPDPENYLTYFMKIDNVKFKQKVLPGDTLIFKCDLITPAGICHMQANAYANGKLVAEAELMAQIAKKP
jgi:UDP-3-O-[3-hydroxymyristoyl] N-acetylglucosamine deacetylase/3-hydroxyacyl-[acyl-carrier-protein] dehydratase